MIILCTAKPCDGLFYYSYEYSKLIQCPCVVVPSPGFTEEDYYNSIKEKYIIFDNLYFEYDEPVEQVFLLGRSMITLPYLNKTMYSSDQLMTLHLLLMNKLIVVYSENHPAEYPNACKYFNPKDIIDLCDYDVYPNGVGEYFEKRINFSIYKEPIEDTQFENLFLGTNQKYYETVESVLPSVDGTYAILTYNDYFVNSNLNNLYAPAKNLLGLFETYVYTKSTFDPAPRLIQECIYFGKKIVYNRDETIRDGGYVYFNKSIKSPDISLLEKYYEN